MGAVPKSTEEEEGCSWVYILNVEFPKIGSAILPSDRDEQLLVEMESTLSV